MSEGIRLQALIARAGIASRRAAESLILEGRVSVNGLVVRELGAKAGGEDTVELDGKAIRGEGRLLYLVLNKPPGYLCAMSDPHGRPLAVDLLKPAIPERVYNVGRLDLESSGLIMFTNDGMFAKAAGHPSSGFLKEYLVETDRDVHRTFEKEFEAGIENEGETLRAERVARNGPRSLSVFLIEGKNREIRRVLREFGLRALVLRRVAIGPLRLGTLPEGSYRPLTSQELSTLHSSMGGNP